MKISVITVNYNSKDYLEKMLLSFQKNILASPKNNHQFEFIIINNDTTPLELPVYEKIIPRLIQSNHNLGYGAANNLAEKMTTGQMIFFINPDTQFVDSSFLDMINYISNNDEVGAIGPKLVLAGGNRPQPWTCGKKTGLLNIFFRNTIGKPWNKQQTAKVDWLSGTALLVRKKDFEKVGRFDEKFFMYYEDQDLCLKIKNLGKIIVFYPSSIIIHHNGKSWDKKTEQKKYYYQSQDYFFKKHHGIFKTKLLQLFRYLLK